MKKRLFEVLDEMNKHDIENNTKLVSVSNHFISGDKVKGGAKISIGVEEKYLYELMEGKKIALLLIIDKKDYDRRNPMKNTIEDPLCMNYNSAGVLMSNKDIPKELRSVSLVDLSVAVELQDENTRKDQTIQALIDDGFNKLDRIKFLDRENQKLKNDLMDCLDVKIGIGPTAITTISDRLAEQKKITEDLVEVLKKIEKMETMSIAKLTTSLALTKYNESIKK